MLVTKHIRPICLWHMVHANKASHIFYKALIISQTSDGKHEPSCSLLGDVSQVKKTVILQQLLYLYFNVII